MFTLFDWLADIGCPLLDDALHARLLLSGSRSDLQCHVTVIIMCIDNVNIDVVVILPAVATTKKNIPLEE